MKRTTPTVAIQYHSHVCGVTDAGKLQFNKAHMYTDDMATISEYRLHLHDVKAKQSTCQI
jgi:hypothetical protein